VRRVNVLAPQFDEASDRDGFRSRVARAGRALESDQIGASVVELEAGQRSHPYHFHHAVEEWLIVLGGSPTLRTPEGARALREHDVVCFPPGPGGAHEVSGPGLVLILSAAHDPDLVEYPESGKLELRPQGTVFRLADAVDLWEDA
jgi:uncharacterized cupin superfamily protein